MALIVQKFGGTSVATPDKIRTAAEKAIRAQQAGNQVVVVVSAMGKNTDTLVDLAGQVNAQPPAREMDMLLATGEQVSVALMAMAIDALGHQAVSLTGAQIGIRTDSSHTKARIISISTERLQSLLDAGNIVIAAGFQGIDEQLDITTLGRGGSDTTAVALAAVLGASSCEIYTDVDGVFTTDPRQLEEARRIDQISYDEMLELASLGAGVMHNRSIEFAKKYSVPIHVRNSENENPGTLITLEGSQEAVAVRGAALSTHDARITLIGVPDVPGTSLEIFSRIADRQITVDMIVQNVGEEGKTDLSFTVPRAELDVALSAIDEASQALQAATVLHDDGVAKVSVVGLGMIQQTGVATQMFRALADANVNIQMITTSEIKISTLVSQEQAKLALTAVHQAFQLDQPPAALDTERALLTQPPRAQSEVADIVDRLHKVGMEELVIDDITLDESQARITIQGIPDTPGIAAAIFEEVATSGVLVDMIIQSFNGAEGLASVSFTIAQSQYDQGLKVAELICERSNCQGMSNSPQVAKLSVSGTGLRSHTGVAIRTFRALADNDINVEMISTSEVRVNIVVHGEHGAQALLQLQEAFQDVLR
jgi:aspartate kinase